MTRRGARDVGPRAWAICAPPARRVEPFDAAVTRVNYRDAFAAAARGARRRGRRSELAGAHGERAAPLLRRPHRRSARARCGAATRRTARSTTCCPPTFEECEPLLDRPMRGRSGGPVVRALARRGRGGARGVDARGGRRGDGVSDDAVQRAARRRQVAGHPHAARLRQLARAAGSVGARGHGRGRNAGAQRVDRRPAGRRCARARAAHSVRAQIAPLPSPRPADHPRDAFPRTRHRDQRRRGTDAALPPLPAPIGIPKPAPATDAPYAPQPILPGGVVVPLYPPARPSSRRSACARPRSTT